MFHLSLQSSAGVGCRRVHDHFYLYPLTFKVKHNTANCGKSVRDINVI